MESEGVKKKNSDGISQLLIRFMVILHSKNLDELKDEIQTRKLEISKEAVISTLIGLDNGLDEVKLEVSLEHNFIDFELLAYMDDFVETFEKNKEALIELEEYELLNQIQKHIG